VSLPLEVIIRGRNKTETGEDTFRRSEILSTVSSFGNELVFCRCVLFMEKNIFLISFLDLLFLTMGPYGHVG